MSGFDYAVKRPHPLPSLLAKLDNGPVTHSGEVNGAAMGTDESGRTESCDVCIVGAGLAGMNALFVASRYLNGNSRVILVDRRARVGGMWVDTYPYVRLHQPHGMFTAGNIAWTLGRDRGYLATKDEVLDQFEHCLDVIRQRIRVDEFFGWTMDSQEDAGGVVRVSCASADGRRMVITARRLITAAGFSVSPNDSLKVSSSRVRSVSPDTCDVRGGEMRASDTPVWVIGGGKTGMDTAHTLITEYPGREVNLVAGCGTFFASRDKCFPTGIRRWYGGTPISRLGAKMTGRFDGTNEADTRAWLRSTYGTWLTPTTGNFLLGVLSDSENKTIAAGLNKVVMDYLVDVVDRGNVTELTLRSGEVRTIQPGSWIVNCTGYLVRDEAPYEPYVSAGGSVLSIQTRSATMHLSSYMGYFLSHLLFLGKLSEIPLYELDMQELRAKSSAALPLAMFSLAGYNLSLIFDSIGSKAFAECGIDFDRWYPAPRRLVETARFLLTHRRAREQQRRALDAMRERFGVRCGPLAPV